MARYHFNVHDGMDHPDEMGTDLADLDAARAHATRYAADLLRCQPQTFWDGTDWRMDVTNERGLILFCLMFAAVDSAAVRSEHVAG